MANFPLPRSTPGRRGLCPYTPKSSRKHFILELETPQTRISRHRKKLVESIFSPASSLPALLLPTPLTVGSGRAKDIEGLSPSKRSKNLTAALQALGDTSSSEYSPGLQIGLAGTSPRAFEGSSRRLLFPSEAEEIQTNQALETAEPETESSQYKAVSGCPLTPPHLVMKQQSFFEDPQSDDDVQIMDSFDVAKIPRLQLSNPFLERGSKPSREAARPVDLSDTIELINHTTGERKLQRMTEEQKRFKPRRLVFTEPSPMKLNYNVTNKFIGKTIGKNFTLDDAPGLAPGFDIYDDHE